MAPFKRVLVRKSKRALKVAGLALDAGDNDSAVSRAYYAMFDIARAALLRAGVTEDELPRTHSGVVEAFRNHGVKSGLIDPALAAELSRVESLRIRADYTGTEIEIEDAQEVVRKAELFIQTVERVFSLNESSVWTEYEHDGPNDNGGVSEPIVGVSRFEEDAARLEPDSPEEIRRQARENWLRLRQQQFQSNKASNREAAKDRAVEGDRGHSLRDDPDG